MLMMSARFFFGVACKSSCTTHMFVAPCGMLPMSARIIKYGIRALCGSNVIEATVMGQSSKPAHTKMIVKCSDLRRHSFEKKPMKIIWQMEHKA